MADRSATTGYPIEVQQLKSGHQGHKGTEVLKDGQESELVPLTLEDLREAAEKFEAEVEKPGGFYDMARGLVEGNHPIEGCILMLATWNGGCFRYAKGFDTEELHKVWVGLDCHFASVAGENIQDIDLEHHRQDIETIFESLAKMDGVRFTGAAKLMHLRLPSVFVPWDSYICGVNAQRYYKNLGCVISKKWCFHRYEKSARGYLCFLSHTQDRVRNLSYQANSRTLAKAVDEFNFVNVTLPIQNLEKAEEREKKRKQNEET